MGGTPLRMLWECCSEPISDKPRSYHLGDVPQNTIWGSFGPLGPSRGICRPNRTAKNRNKSCIGQIGAVWKCVLVSGANKPFHGYKIQKHSKENVFYSKTTVFFNRKPFFKKNCVLLHRVPIATGTMNILCCKRGAPQAHLAIKFPTAIKF